MKIQDLRGVVSCWLNGKPASTKNNSFSTNGKELYSYRLVIATKDEDRNSNIVYDYTASGVFVSQTTSRHVGMAMKHANIKLDPSVALRNI